MVGMGDIGIKNRKKRMNYDVDFNIMCFGWFIRGYLLSKETTKEKGVGCLGFVIGFFGTFFQYILPILVFIAIIKLIFF